MDKNSGPMETVGNVEFVESENGPDTKKRKRGIVYLSSIPKYMNIAKIRELFSVYGKIGRVYLQLAENG